jgi:hypothetical protein
MVIVATGKPDLPEGRGDCNTTASATSATSPDQPSEVRGGFLRVADKVLPRLLLDRQMTAPSL